MEVCERVLAGARRACACASRRSCSARATTRTCSSSSSTRRGIPFVKYGGLRFLEAAHVKDLIALLRVSANNADEISWFRLLQLLEGVGPVRARRILEAMRPPAGGAPEPRRWPEVESLVPEASRAAAAALFEVVATEEEPSGTGARIEELCNALAPLIRARYADWSVRLEDYEQLMAIAREASDLISFASDLLLDPPASSADLAGPPLLDEDYLVLSTVHSAKGLEWDAVHLIAAYDGNFPADMNAGSKEGVAEERRLLYVALTRARRRLHVYVPFRYYHRPRARDDGHGYGKASRFLDDEVQALFTVTRPAAQEPGLAGASPGTRRIEVSIDALLV